MPCVVEVFGKRAPPRHARAVNVLLAPWPVRACMGIIFLRRTAGTVDRVGVDGEATIMICLPSSLVTSWGGFVSTFN